MDGATSLQNIIDYHFKNDKLLNEAILAAGASVSDVQVDGNKQGNKGLALIGDALIRLAIVDQGYADGARTGEDQGLSGNSRLTSHRGKQRYCQGSRIKYVSREGCS
jgi:ribonuclease-3